jgi:hypothetical protein
MFSGLVLVAIVGLGPALVLRRLHRRQLAQPRPVVARAAVGGRVDTQADRRADEWTLEVGVPEDWVELPRRPQGSDLVGRDAAGEPGTVDRGDVDPDAWARQAADELLGGADADGRDELAQVLADHVRLSWERSSILSALYVPVPELAGDAVEGIAVLAALEPELGADLDGVRRTFGSDAIDRRRMFDAIELPLGPALSAHLVDLDAVAGLGEDVDGVTYWLTVPQASRLVSLMVQWREHRPGDEMKLEARSIAESLAFVRL